MTIFLLWIMKRNNMVEILLNLILFEEIDIISNKLNFNNIVALHDSSQKMVMQNNWS